MQQIIEREMTISHRDFFRILPKALGSYPYQQHENVITAFLNEGQNDSKEESEIVIILAEEQLRQIASLTLPITNVTFQIKNVAENTKNEFFKQFDRAYRRGGG